MTRMAARGAFLTVMVLAAVAAADPKPKPVDIKPIRDKLVVLKDADGGTYAVVNEKGGERRVFYGATPKVLHETVLEGGAFRDGDSWSVSVIAPTTEFPFIATIERKKDGTYLRTCGPKGADFALTELTGDKAKEILDKSTFLTTQFIRRPHLLARDDKGVYYYVDVLRDAYGGNGHRVFVGKKGAMKQVPLTDVASDTGGEVYSTKSGDLRLVSTSDTDSRKKTAQWIRGERKSELVYLDHYMNQPLIFRDLGIYKLTGTMCGSF